MLSVDSTGKDVVVKHIGNGIMDRLQKIDRNDRNAFLDSTSPGDVEDPLAEIGVMMYLEQLPDKSPYLLRMLSVFSDCSLFPEHVWLVTEYANGGDLFEEVRRQGRLSEADAKRHFGHLLRAVQYLDQHDIGHRDISLENILLKDGEVRLMDFGQAARSRSSNGQALRYFRKAGKECYRAPEANVPRVEDVCGCGPPGSSPGDVVSVDVREWCSLQVRLPLDMVPERPCTADVWGYELPAADVFSVGMCLFMMLYGQFLFRRSVLSDEIFAHLHQVGFEAALDSLGLQAPDTEALGLLTGMLHSDPAQRISVADCLRSPWVMEDDWPCRAFAAGVAGPIVRSRSSWIRDGLLVGACVGGA